MGWNLRRVFGTSPNTDPYRSLAGLEAGPLHGTVPMGLLSGDFFGIGCDRFLMANQWKFGGAGTAATADGDPTLLQLTSGTTANAGPQIQASKDNGTTAWAAFKAQSGKALWFRAHVKIDADINNCALLVGLVEVDTAVLTGAGAVDFANGIYVIKAAGAASLAGVLRKTSTSTSQTLTGYDMVADTYKQIDIVIPDGAGVVLFYIDGVLVYRQTTLTNLPTANLAPTIALVTTNTTQKIASVKRGHAFKEAA